MTYEQPSSLSFSIKESVWLNRGSEIDELLSLVLEPDISIQEEGDQVFVRGNLQLYGEYRPKEAEENDSGTFADQVSFRSVEEVSMSDDGVGLIRHSFPLDVTIPKERIDNLDNLFVTVDEFDYELPGKGCIELEANVSVSGIKSDQSSYSFSEARNDSYEESFERSVNQEQSTPEPEQFEDSRVSYNEFQYEEPNVNEEPVESFQPEQEDDERSFHFEAVRPAEEEPNEEDYVLENVDDGESRYQGQEFGEVEAEAEPNIEQDTTSEEPVEVEPARGETSNQEEPTPVEVVDAVTSDEGEERVESTTPTVKFASNPNVSSVDDDRPAGEGEENGSEAAEVQPRKEENALYLTKMLTKGEEEFSKLKMCIVQDGETLEMIAERYKLQVSQLVRMNRLNEDRVSEGEILYIPVKATVSSETSDS
ncbi:MULTISPECIES: stage VI sporulation protein D [Bacillaceae]|uniref:Stage VI sporulation protein D n=1 Tax=Evansella alkalicola TaxID=745819 RepID=A0ABS6JTP3_9BACI|nr:MULTISPECIES: stage VI sporulation protein D [Bacillaceae]MBU9721940.1 stage VI sporulation protein D [Bacillus alkalicola]